MMDMLSYLLPRPAFDLTPEKTAAFAALRRSTPPGGLVEYNLPHPKWQYLSWLCQADDLVLHGSQNLSIATVEPRQAIDIRAYSNQDAIYATTDGIWVIYFAILNRKKFKGMSLFNSCLQARLAPDQLSDPLYFFSISHFALVNDPWCEGMIYILPRVKFEREPAQDFGGVEILFPHWISRAPAEPVARLQVNAQDFPFLAQVHGHDDEKLTRLAKEDPNGYPWPEALIR